MNLNPDFIRDIPKSDLHVHLDGSLRINTIIELAKERKISLPSMTESGLRELVFKPHYADLVEYLDTFRYTVAVLQDAEGLERAAAELAEDALAEGVRYIEVRFAPQLHCQAGFSFEDVFGSVDRGLARTQKTFNARPEVVQGIEPPFYYGIIACAMRQFTAAFSPYYNGFVAAHQYSPERTIARLASLELAQAAVAIRDRYGLPIVGFDLAGQEYGYPAEDHSEAYQYIHKHFMKKTVHAGEAFGPESIFQAITDLHADRIGHGFHLFDEKSMGPKIPAAERARYIEQLTQYIADRRVTIEVCLTSNLQTSPELGEAKNHAFGKMLAMRLSTSLCTDNRLQSNTTVSREIEVAVKAFGIQTKDLRNLIIYGFKRSFFPGSYQEKRTYVHDIIDYYDRILLRYEGQEGLHGI